MPWSFVVHPCELPDQEEIDQYELNSLWKCPVCRSVWKRVFSAGSSKDKTGLLRFSYNSVEGNPPPVMGMEDSPIPNSWGGGSSIADEEIPDIGRLVEGE